MTEYRLHKHVFQENSKVAWRAPNMSAGGYRHSLELYLLIIYTIEAVISASCRLVRPIWRSADKCVPPSLGLRV